VRHNTDIDLPIDPPPDLVIEIDTTHSSLDKLPIYAALGIPEVWRYARQQLSIYQLSTDGYTVVDTSTILPVVTSPQLTQLVADGHHMPRPTWLRHIRIWAWSLQYDTQS
jgi:Uma2 family endonuclease